MHAVSVLQKCLYKSFALMDKRRVRVLLGAVSALLAGRRLVLMELARHWPGALRVRAPLKRLDRMLSNPHLHRERIGLYASMSQLLVRHKQPVILVDWSPLKADGQWQLLRAAVAVGGRSLTLYEAVYPQQKMASPKVERVFLARLATLIPPQCTPIVVTDAGYRAPWFRAVTQHGWDYVGRLRGRTRVQLKRQKAWFPMRSLYSGATHRAQRFTDALIVESHPWMCNLVVCRRARRGRVHRSCHGKRLHTGHSRKQAKREREPWVLVTSLSAEQVSNKQIIDMYSRRMQIEQSFRDLKSARFGCAFRYSLTRTAKRIEILLLVHALATLVAWLAGLSLQQSARNAYTGMNTQRSRRHYSPLRLGFEALKRGHIRSIRLLWRTLVDPPSSVLNQMALVT